MSGIWLGEAGEGESGDEEGLRPKGEGIERCREGEEVEEEGRSGGRCCALRRRARVERGGDGPSGGRGALAACSSAERGRGISGE